MTEREASNALQEAVDWCGKVASEAQMMHERIMIWLNAEPQVFTPEALEMLSAEAFGAHTAVKSLLDDVQYVKETGKFPDWWEWD